jgi:hypothetical protein
VRCAFFATLEDRLSAGCTAGAETRDDWAYHLLAALRDPSADLDGDGRVGLAEADARARIRAGSIDLPTRTSERWLRDHARSDADALNLASPLQALVAAAPKPDAAVLTALATILGIAGEARPALLARYEVDRAEATYARLQDALARAEMEVARLQGRLAASLVARFPALGSPLGPAFGSTVAEEGAAILAFLFGHPDWPAFQDARDERARLDGEIAGVETRAAPWHRFLRAAEDAALVTDLRATAAPEVAARYDALCACEARPIR